MKRVHLPTILVVVLLVVGGLFVYHKFINKG